LRPNYSLPQLVLFLSRGNNTKRHVAQRSVQIKTTSGGI